MFEERFESCKKDILDILLSYDVDPKAAEEFTEKYYQKLVERGIFSHGLRDDLKNLFGDKDISVAFNEMAYAVKKYQMTFAERIRFNVDEEVEFDTLEEAERFKDDLLAFHHLESICDGKTGCEVTKEDKWMFYILLEGFDPENWDFVLKPNVSKEEVEQFRELCKKFGVKSSFVSAHIDNTLQGTPSYKAQRLVSQQEEIDKRRSRHHEILTRGVGAFWKQGMNE